MKALLTATVGTLALGLAAPAASLAQDAPTHHHHHHHWHGKHAVGKSQGSAGDEETAKLNEQSLENARSGRTPASGSASGPATGSDATSSAGSDTGATNPHSPGASAATPNPNMPASNQVPATAAPGTGLSSPTGSSGTQAPPAGH